MTTNTRPSTARKHTRTTKEKRAEDLDRGIRITIDRDTFEVRVGDVTPELAAEIRATTGMSFIRLMDTISDDPDVDVLTIFEWVARRLRGESIALDEVAFTYVDMASDVFELDEAGPRGKTDESDEADPKT